MAQAKKGGWLRAVVVGALGLGGGAAGTYATSVVDKIARAPLPVANFAVAADGLTVTCQNHASGDSGWWDFGDGSPLEPFDPTRPVVPHTYGKPGSYTVKLVVRNFTADENERSVAVEVTAVGKDVPAAPQIAAFAVQPVSPASVAPATFRLTADVRDAEHCVFDFGDGRLEVGEGGRVDRLVTFDKPGAFPIQLVAHNARAAAKQATAVRVDAPKDGTLMAVLKVADTGTRVERLTRSETVAVPAPKDRAGTAFTRAVAARPGFTLLSAVPANPNTPGVKNLAVRVAADKKTAAVSGEWAGDPKAKGTGSDVLIPLKLVEERATVVQSPPETVTGVFTPVGGRTTLALPLPRPEAGVTGTQRRMSLEIRQATGNGQSRVLSAAPNVKLPWAGRVGGLITVRAELRGEDVVLTIGG